MDTASTLIGVGLLLVFIVPIAYILFSQSRKEKRNKKYFIASSEKHELAPSKTEFLSDLLLGLDEKSKKILVIQKNAEPKEQLIDLKGIKSIEISNLKGAQGNIALDEINEISMALRNSQNSNTRKIVFFDGTKNSVLEKEGRLNSALKWQHLLKSNIVHS